MGQFYRFYAPLNWQQPVAKLENMPDTSNLQQPVANLENIDNYPHDENRLSTQNGIRQQAVAQIPWGHNILIFIKSVSVAEAQFYIQQTIVNGRSRNILALQLKTNLYQRTGKAINNFSHTLVSP